jgi:hypothetical protein
LSLAVIFRPAAEQEIREAHAWYEEKHPGLGDAFVSEVEQAAGRVRERPELYAEVHGPIRRALFHRFPYGRTVPRSNEAIGVRNRRNPEQIFGSRD